MEIIYAACQKKCNKVSCCDSVSPLLSAHLSCNHSTEMKWSPYPKDSNGKIDNATYVPGRYENIYLSHNEVFWGV